MATVAALFLFLEDLLMADGTDLNNFQPEPAESKPGLQMNLLDIFGSTDSPMPAICSVYVPPIDGEEALFMSVPDVAQALANLGNPEQDFGVKCSDSKLVANAFGEALQQGESTAEYFTDAVNKELLGLVPDLSVSNEIEYSNADFVPANKAYDPNDPNKNHIAHRLDYCEDLGSMTAEQGTLGQSNLQLSFNGENIYETAVQTAMPPFDDRESWTLKRQAQANCDIKLR